MDLLTKANFEFAITILLPGFVILALFMTAFRTRLPNSFYVIIASVILSFFYTNALTTIQSQFAAFAKPAPKPWADLVNLVFVPAVLGYIGGYIWEIISPKIRGFGIAVRSPIPTAWDYAFAKRTHCWLLIRFKDGAPPVRAWYCGESFAGTDLPYRDLYITQIHSLQHPLDSSGNRDEQAETVWEQEVPPLAIWVAGTEIHSIEFTIEPDNGDFYERIRTRLSAYKADIKRRLSRNSPSE